MMAGFRGRVVLGMMVVAVCAAAGFAQEAVVSPPAMTALFPANGAMGVSPEEAKRPGWTPTSAEVARLRPHLAKEYDLHSLTSCSTCHR